jgi:hypothetical protein
VAEVSGEFGPYLFDGGCETPPPSPKPEQKPREKQGRELAFEKIEPWPLSVDGAALLDELVTTFRRYLVLPRGAA